MIIRKVCTGWSGDITADTITTTILVDEPKTLTAIWKNDYVQLYALIAGLLGLAVITSVTVVKIRRRAPRVFATATMVEQEEFAKISPVPTTNMEFSSSDISVLMNALKDKGNLMRGKAAEALYKIGNAAVPALISALNDKDHYVRLKAAEVLGEIGNKTAISPLIDVMNDKDQSVRNAASEALKKITAV